MHGDSITIELTRKKLSHYRVQSVTIVDNHYSYMVYESNNIRVTLSRTFLSKFPLLHVPRR